jgi:hypothetical protein
MSKIAYLVFAYRNPQLLKRAIKMLSTEHCAFFVHIDQKIDIEQFSCISGDNVFFTDKRVLVYWGEFSGIDAILALIREALGRPERYDYFVLLSGSEYPLKCGRYIHTFLQANQGLEFISLLKMPSPGKPISRINTLRVESDKPVRRLAWRVLAKLGMAERDYREYLGGLEPYSGVTWWTLSRNACEYVLRFTESNPHVERFFRDTFAPEESFIHTILGNSLLRDRVRGNFVFEDWRPGGDRDHDHLGYHLPQNLTTKHVAFFEAQEKVWLDDSYGRREAFFARKFSDDKLDLVDRLEAMIMRKEERAQGLVDDGSADLITENGSYPI